MAPSVRRSAASGRDSPAYFRHQLMASSNQQPTAISDSEPVSVRSHGSALVALTLAVPGMLFILLVLVAPLRQPGNRTTPNIASRQQESQDAAPEKQADANPTKKQKTSQKQTKLSQQIVTKPERPELSANEVGEFRLPGPPDIKKDPRPDPPWQEVLALPARDLPDFQEVCFRPQSLSAESGLSREQFLKWLQPVDGVPYRVWRAYSNRKIMTGMSGRLRWLAPWKPDTSLMLGVAQSIRFRIHLIGQDKQAVTLVHNGTGSNAWVAYRSQNDGAGLIRPVQLVARVQSPVADTSRSPIGIRCTGSAIVLHRGDLQLMRVPFVGQPRQSWWEGQTLVFQLTLQRTKNFPLRQPRADTPVASHSATSRSWQFQRPGLGKTIALPDDSIQLQAFQANVAYCKLDRPYLHETRLFIEDPVAGCSVGFADSESNSIGDRICFVRNRTTGRLCVVLRRKDTDELALGHPTEKMIPCVGRSLWIRFVPGIDHFRCWVGTTGQDWVELSGPYDSLPPRINSIGFALPSQSRIQVTRLESRAMRPLIDLADQRILATAPTFPDSENTLPSWLAHCAATQPANLGWTEWRQACTVRTLLDGCPSSLGRVLLFALLQDVVESDRPLPQRMSIIRAGMSLLRFRSRSQKAERDRIFSSVLRTNPVLPVTNRSLVSLTGSKSVIADRATIRRTLLQRLYAGQWVETLELCEQLQFFGMQQRSDRFVDWARFIATRQLPGSSGDSRVGRRYPNWRHPYVEELNKETYNVLAELRAIVNTKSFPDAARMITTVAGENLTGVAPSGSDRAHLLSLTAAIRQAVSEHSELRQVIENRYGALASLRIRSAMKAGNEPQVRLASVQFEATPAAAEARRWLGDRALVLGRFAESLAEYRRALPNASVALRREVKSRIQLVSAMAGSKPTSQVDTSIQLGDVKLSGAQFKALLAEFNKSPLAHLVREPAAISPLEPKPLRVGKRVKWKWSVGIHPGRQITSGINQHNVPWVARQIAVTTTGKEAYVSNRFHVARLNLQNGTVVWLSKMPAKHKPMYSRNWTLIPTKPIVTASHVITRTMHGRGPLIRCLERKTGKQLWIIEPSKDEQFASDPIALLDDIVVFVVKPAGRTEQVLQLLRLDAESGEVLRRRDILRLRASWATRQICQVTANDEGAFVTLGGASFSIDSSGNLRWLRKHVVVPTDIDSSWVNQTVQPPRLWENRVILTSPGVRSVECVDAATGKLHWRSTFSDLEKCVGVASQTVVVRVKDAYLGLDAANGKQVWRLPIDPSRATGEGEICQGRHLVISERVVLTLPKRQVVPQLVWFDLVERRTIQRQAFRTLEAVAPTLGPFFFAQGKWWTFFGKTYNQTDRELIQFTAAPQNTKVARYVASSGNNEHETNRPLAKVPRLTGAFSAWRVFQGRATAYAETKTVVIQVDKKTITAIGRQLTDGPFDKAVLQLESIAENVNVTVRHASKIIWRSPSQAAAKAKLEGRPISIPLARARGGWITIHVSGNGRLVWQNLDLVKSNKKAAE